MPEKYTYLLVDFFCIIVPFLFSFHPKINFHKQWNYFWAPCLLTAFFFLVWDALFTNAGVWGFNPRYISGIYLYNLPIEECLFFLCIPYSCVFTYYCIVMFSGVSINRLLLLIITIILVLFLCITGFTHMQKLYTSITFLLLATLLTSIFLKKNGILSPFYMTYLLILLPFFISNGILTGSFLNRPTVLYNNDYNLGIRILTIPIEDLFYAMLLLLMNIGGFEYLKSKSFDSSHAVTVEE